MLGVNDRPYAKMKSPPKALELKQNVKTYADILTQEGYVCGLVGKWHAGHTPEVHGFSKMTIRFTSASITQPRL